MNMKPKLHAELNIFVAIILAVAVTNGCGKQQLNAAAQQGQTSASKPTGLSSQATEDLFEQSIKADIRKDFKTELQLCKQLADSKDVRGEECLSELYSAGKQGIPKDMRECLKWLQSAADGGEAFAQSTEANIAVMGPDLTDNSEYRHWHPLHPADEVYWLRKVAEQGDQAAQFNLAIRLYDHNGVPQDDVESYQWATAALDNRDWLNPQTTIAAIKNMRNTLARRMTRDQLAEGSKRAHEWQPKVSEATRIMQEAAKTQRRLRGGKYIGPYSSSALGSGPR